MIYLLDVTSLELLYLETLTYTKQYRAENNT